MKCRCNKCEATRQRERRRTPGWKEWKRNYEKSELGKLARRRYKGGSAGKAANKRYKMKFRASERGKEEARAYSRISNLRKYGLTEDAYKAMLIGQAFGCAICGRQSPSSHRKNLYVDHCHKTKKIRGLLCGRCNSAIGFVNDDPIILEKMLRYVVGGGIPR